jgi:exoribonuclease II
MMLNKKYQVLLSKWMDDYLKFICERYDLNFSSAIRVHMCLGFLYSLSMIQPNHKVDLQKDVLTKLSKKACKNELAEEEIHQFLSKIIFEARKAVEFRLSKEKDKKTRDGMRRNS